MFDGIVFAQLRGRFADRDLDSEIDGKAVDAATDGWGRQASAGLYMRRPIERHWRLFHLECRSGPWEQLGDIPFGISLLFQVRENCHAIWHVVVSKDDACDIWTCF